MCSLTPAATQYACAATVSGLIGASSPRMKIWFSSMRAPSQGSPLHNRGTAGGEFEALTRDERRAVERGDAGLDGEAAAHAGGQVTVEIVHPVLRVGPASLALFDAVDRERIDFARVAERNHRLREARSDLAHALDLALRRKEFDALRECGRSTERERSENCRSQDWYRAGVLLQHWRPCFVGRAVQPGRSTASLRVVD